MSSFSFLPKKDPKSSLLALIRSRVAIAIAPHFHTQLCTILTTLATKVARYLRIIFSRWFVFSRGIFVVLIDFNTARSVHLTKGYCIQWGNCKPGGRGGMIYTLGNLWKGCAAWLFKSWQYFRPKKFIFHTYFQTYFHCHPAFQQPPLRNRVIIS